jgi:hypothetical protein
MLRKLVRFMPWHLDWLDEHGEPGAFTAPHAVRVELMKQNSWTGIVDGSVMFCAGTVMQWPGRHTSWAVLHKDSGPHMLWITRMVRANLASVQGRIELTVRADFPQGMHWARLLGFIIESPVLEKYGPEGEDHVGYVRIN